MNPVQRVLNENFDKHQVDLINYTFLCLAYESSKFVVMFIISSCFHMTHEYCASILVLFSIRNFTGGLHLDHYISCFLFTCGFIGSALLLSEYIFPDNNIRVAIVALSAIAVYITGPVTSKNRPPLAQGQYRTFRLIATIIISIYLLAFLFMKTFPYSNICFWVIVLQTLQLIAAKILKKGEKI